METISKTVQVSKINKETFVEAWAEAGLIVTDSPADPAPSLRIENGQIVEMDGKPRADLFVKDGLHLSPKGYALWNVLVAPFLE